MALIPDTLRSVGAFATRARIAGRAERLVPESQKPPLLFHELFDRQAEQTPDAVAVEYDSSRLTYQELRSKANQLAHFLQRSGVGPGVLVAICCARSLEVMVGILGILKAGGAYVPLDPFYPAERLAFMLEDAAPAFLLTHSKLAGNWPAAKAPVLCLDTLEMPAITTDPVTKVTRDDLAYVIYTSGSTGRPKGAMIHHGGLVNYLTWAVEAYDVASGSGAPVHSSISFDLTITALFLPLLAGRTVYMLPEDSGVESLATALTAHRNLSLVKLTPAHLELLQLQLSPEVVAGCARCFVIGGENLVGEALAWWQQHAPDTVLVNEYGPTETVVGCCVFAVRNDQRITGSVPIGRPIASTQLHILDDERRPVRSGETGELYIGGAGVGLGYLNRPDLTAERFLPDPFSNNADGRLYRTGDLTRQLPSGDLEFIGRLDDQVKIRGYRIELGEIEAVLRRHPAVAQAAVVVKESGMHKRLDAYVVPAAGQTISASELRIFLEGELPAYSIPAAFIFLDSLPLTPTGKVDRRALRPSADRKPGEVLPPTSETEATLLGIWEEVLGVRPIGMRDNFFELGGDSLLGVALVLKIEAASGRKLPLASLLRAPTIEQLASLMEADATEPQWSLLRVIQPQGSKPPFFCVPGFYDLARYLGKDQPFYGLDVPSLEEMTHEKTFVEQTASKCLEELLGVQAHGPYYLGGHSFGGVLAFEIAHQLQERGEEVALLALLDPDPPRPFPTETIRFNLNRYAFHIEQLQQRAVSDQLRYFLNGAGHSVKRINRRMRDLGKTLATLVHGGAKNSLYEAPAYDGKITIFFARETQFRRKPNEDPRLEWADVAQGGIETHEWPGDHATFLREPHVRRVANQLRVCLTVARGSSLSDADEGLIP